MISCHKCDMARINNQHFFFHLSLVLSRLFFAILPPFTDEWLVDGRAINLLSWVMAVLSIRLFDRSTIVASHVALCYCRIGDVISLNYSKVRTYVSSYGLGCALSGNRKLFARMNSILRDLALWILALKVHYPHLHNPHTFKCCPVTFGITSNNLSQGSHYI